MSTRNALERLEAAGRPLLADPDPLVDVGEQERILKRILASDRERSRPRGILRLRPALLLVGALVVAAAVAAALATRAFDSAAPRAVKPAAHHHVALTGPRIELAGYRFRTPAGFKVSDAKCPIPPGPAGPDGSNGFAAAASAQGGCLGAYFMLAMPGASTPADGATPVPVGDYSGYFVPANSSGESALYVQLPTFYNGTRQYLALYSEGLTEQQLVAIAQSGLPGNPAAATNEG